MVWKHIDQRYNIDSHTTKNFLRQLRSEIWNEGRWVFHQKQFSKSIHLFLPDYGFQDMRPMKKVPDHDDVCSAKMEHSCIRPTQTAPKPPTPSNTKHWFVLAPSTFFINMQQGVYLGLCNLSNWPCFWALPDQSCLATILQFQKQTHPNAFKRPFRWVSKSNMFWCMPSYNFKCLETHLWSPIHIENILIVWSL